MASCSLFLAQQTVLVTRPCSCPIYVLPQLAADGRVPHSLTETCQLDPLALLQMIPWSESSAAPLVHTHECFLGVDEQWGCAAEDTVTRKGDWQQSCTSRELEFPLLINLNKKHIAAEQQKQRALPIFRTPRPHPNHVHISEHSAMVLYSLFFKKFFLKMFRCSSIPI